MAANRYELLAAWYLRLNGYFTTPDFIVHKDYRVRPGGTDADVLAVRFPHSKEFQRRFEFDCDPSLVVYRDKVDFLVCEVKGGLCDLNDPWLNADRRNVEYVARWMGFEGREPEIKRIAEAVYADGIWEAADHALRFVVIGATQNQELSRRFPRVSQITHIKLVEFLQRRFTTDCEGINRQHWDPLIVDFAERCASGNLEKLLMWAAVAN